MKYFITAFLLFFCLSGNLSAQNAWRKSKRSAETAERTGNFAEAAALYEASWKDNNKKTKLIYQAGELYAILRDYQRAADCYKEVKEDKDFPVRSLLNISKSEPGTHSFAYEIAKTIAPNNKSIKIVMDAFLFMVKYFIPFSNSKYITGSTNKVNIVEIINPPITTVAKGF